MEAADEQVDLLERMLDSSVAALPTEAARRLVVWRADDEAQRRIDELAAKCNEGLLTSGERAEYESLVNVGSMIALFQARARAILARNTAA